MFKRRIPLSINDKLEVLEDIENGLSTSDISKKFRIYSSTICKIKQNRDNIERFTAETNINPKLLKRMRHPKYEEVERLLHQWFLEQRVMKKIITNDLLKMKAQEFHQNLGRTDRFLVSDG